MLVKESTFGATPDAVTFNERINTNAGRKALLGDPGKWVPGVTGYNQFAVACEAVEEGLKKVRALEEDRTRTLPQKHDAARTVTNRVVASLTYSEAEIRKLANKLCADAEDAIIAKLDEGKIRSKVWDMIVDFLKRNAGTPEGHKIIREKVKTDPEVAAVLFYGKGFLLDLPDQLQGNLFREAYQTHVPEAQKRYDQASELLRFADNYERVRNGVGRHWYSGAMADQVATRVEV